MRIRSWFGPVVCWLTVTSLCAAATTNQLQLWVYLQTNLQNTNAAYNPFAHSLLVRAAAAGYTGMVLSDTQLEKPDAGGSWYNGFLQPFLTHASNVGITVTPMIYSFGYSQYSILPLDKNLAEPQPIVGAGFTVSADKSSLVFSNSFTGVIDGGFENHSGNTFTSWSWQDAIGTRTFADTTNVHGGSCSFRIGAGTGLARLIKTNVPVTPWRQYHVSVWMMTSGFSGSQPDVEVIGVTTSAQLNYDGSSGTLPCQATQPWLQYDYFFNSASNTLVNLYVGDWGTVNGSIWFDDLSVQETALVNLVRRTGAPLTICNASNTNIVYNEPNDVNTISDPAVPNTGYSGQFTNWHTPPTVTLPAGTSLTAGQQVKINYYAVNPVYSSEVGACLTAPGIAGYMSTNVAAVASIFPANVGIMMSYDEMRHLNTCASCVAMGQTAGGLLGWHVSNAVSTIHSVCTNATIYAWNDMFDPYHNATTNAYYFDGGPVYGSWTGLPSSVIIMNWNSANRANSLAFFSGLGNRQFIAGYYDSGNGTTSASNELKAAQGIVGFQGLMYTTWIGTNGFNQLENYAAAAKAPTLTAGPTNVAVSTGQSAAFAASATAPTPLTYQWQRNATNIAGATGASYSFFTTAGDNGAHFACLIGDYGGSVLTDPATLTLTDQPFAPIITAQPSGLTVNVGQPATFTVAANGTAPLYYQWQKNGTNIAGATSATEAIAAAQLTDAGSYTAIISNSLGSVTSSAATLTVNDTTWSGWTYLKAITINHGQVAATQTSFPVLIVINDDHDLAAHARADGADLVFSDSNGNLLAYEIEASYLPTGGATGGTKARVWVNIPNLSSTADTVVNLRYGNPSCSVSKQNAAQVWTSGFVGVWHLGESASPAYDLTGNGANMTGNSGSTFGAAGEIGNAVSFDGSTGFLINNNAPALVLAGSPGTISAWIYPKALSAGTRVCSIGTSGTAESYQFALAGGNTFRFGFPANGLVSSTSTLSSNTWQQIVTAWDGTNVQFYLQGAAAGTAAYAFYPPNNGTTFKIGDSVQFSGKWNGTVDEIRISSVVRSAGWIATEYNNQGNPSAFASLGSEWSTPVVVTPPSPQTVDVGQGAFFSVAASGTSPLFYQWRLNGTNIVNATNATYSIASVSATNAGTYIVTISNVVSSITSIAAMLTVNVWPVITTISSLPAGTVGIGYSQTLIATNGTPPYTWSATGGALPGGLTFDATGLLSGTPTATGTFNFIAQVTDSVSVTTNGNFALTINPALALLSAFSRKTHGASGTFDLPLMLDPTSNATVEPRLGGPTTLIFNFNTNVAATGGVLNAGSFTLTNVTYSAASISASNLTLNLTNAVDQSVVTVVLSGITDSAGNPLTGTNAVRIRSLYGDVNQSGTVNAVDLQQVKNNLLATLTPANFLCDVNCSGTINAVDLQQIKNNLLHTASLSSGGSGLVVSGLSMTPALAAATLGEALGATNLTWSTDGDAVWTPTITKDGSSAAWSGHIGNLNVSWVETTVTGPGTLSFDWMVSSELNGDYLTFSIDGVSQPGAISGEVGWQTLTFSIPAGTHRLTWIYSKNGATAAGLDAGWLRRVVYR